MRRTESFCPESEFLFPLSPLYIHMNLHLLHYAFLYHFFYDSFGAYKHPSQKQYTLATMELSLDLSLSFVPKTISLFLGDVSRSKDMSEKLGMLEDFLRRLEDEMRKIDAFKRELPLCMLLVNDAVTRLKEEKVRCMGMQQDPPVTVRTNSEGNGTLRESCDNKKNWMSSVQLWSAESNSKSRCEEEDHSVPENPIQTREQHHNNRSGGALFNRNSCAHKVAEVKEVSQVPSFSLMIPESEVLNRGNSKSGSNSLLMGRVEVHGQPQAQPHQHHLQQNPRKQRRCWSPELHRRFIDALQQLGGAQVATPKQIRELMQVEGLTNDEVKSHLQKYRLHVRRFPEQANNNNGLWAEQDQCAKGKENSSSQSGSPQGPLLLGGSVKGLSSPGRNSADAEDEQSDCRNWKGGLHWQPESCD